MNKEFSLEVTRLRQECISIEPMEMDRLLVLLNGSICWQSTTA